MRSAIFFASLLAIVVQAQPTDLEARAPSSGDTEILNFALTLEHVEDAFYKLGLSQFSQRDFINAGLPAGARQQFVEISQHESTHVAFLTNILGKKATKPCTYKFPFTDPKSFSALAQVLENVGTSAYTGATSSLSKQYITGSASILGTEARQASLLAAYVNGVEGWGNAFNQPLTQSQAFTLASPFIVKCPSSNPRLPVQAFPSLSFPKSFAPGQTVSVTFKSNTKSQLYAVFLFGLGQQVVPVRNGKVTIPRNLAGQCYCIISSSPNGVTDRTTVAGPAILQFEYSLTGQFIGGN